MKARETQDIVQRRILAALEDKRKLDLEVKFSGQKPANSAKVSKAEEKLTSEAGKLQQAIYAAQKAIAAQ